jgi:hypothetical protein
MILQDSDMNSNCQRVLVLNVLSYGFHEVINKKMSFDQVRDHLRSLLQTKSPREYPRGLVGISVTSLAKDLLSVNKTVTSSQY